MRKCLLAAVAILAMMLCRPVDSMAQVTLKDALKCRKAVATKVNGLIKAGFSVVDGCHAQRDKGKFQGDCNDLAGADAKGKFAGLVAKFEPEVDKKCSADNPVRDNFPNGFDVDAIERVRDGVEDVSDDVLGAPALTKEQKVEAKCHKALAKGRLAVIAEIVKAGTKCQQGADKTASTVEELVAIAPACLVPPGKAAKVAEAICKACGGKDKLCDGTDDVDPAAVDSCTPLPSCVIAAASATGEQLARAIYGQPTECGNDVIEVGEVCDDGNTTNGDGCDSNCTPTGCGNGVTSSGEECDDGNQLDTDGCVDGCKLAVCGDGFVYAGVERCGDGTGESCTDPNQNTCPIGDCTPGANTRTLVASFSAPEDLAGLTLVLDYPEHKTVVPGFFDGPGKKRCVGGDNNNALCSAASACPGGSCESRITIVPTPSGASAGVNDEDFDVLASLVSFGSTFAAGEFVRIKLNDCDGAAAAAIDEFACLVDNASNANGDNVTAGVRCSIALE